MLAEEAEKCGLVSSVFESKVAKWLQGMVWKNIVNIWAASFLLYLITERLKEMETDKRNAATLICLGEFIYTVFQFSVVCMSKIYTYS